jgi:hypothetical protein
MLNEEGVQETSNMSASTTSIMTPTQASSGESTYLLGTFHGTIAAPCSSAMINV